MNISVPENIQDNGSKDWWYIKDLDYRPLDKPDYEDGGLRDYWTGNITKRDK